MGFKTALDAYAAARKYTDEAVSDKIDEADIGVPGGLATLNSLGKVPESQLPSYVDDIEEYATRSAFPETGEFDKLYVARDTNILYRWSGSTYVSVSEPDIASVLKPGIVKPDGTTITIDVDGTIHGANQTPIATTTTPGIVKPDGTSITVEQDGTISANGGHTIYDEEGTALAQRDGLQFLNSDVENVNGKTVVTPKGKADYEFETYQDMMDAIENEEVEPDSTIYVMEGDETVNPGGSGGHIIEDADGTELEQRDILQFAGTLKATDDDVNEKTVISDAAEEVEWSVWNEMTEEERDEYSAGKKIDIVNVPGADGTISADLMTLLWENPNPSAAFATQSISLDLSGYDYIFIEYKMDAGGDTNYANIIAPINSKASRMISLTGTMTAATGTVLLARDVVPSITGITFGDGWYTYSGTTMTIDNSRAVPTKIYGIKKTINLKINVIASDVSTSASKCMMSDGRSVEDAVKALVGTVQIFAGATIPDGYLLCDGSPVSRTTYSDLYAVIGDTWGAGDGSTTFNLPDLREVAPVGVGTSTRTEGNHDTYALGEFKDDQLQNHTHNLQPNYVVSGTIYNHGYMGGVYSTSDTTPTTNPISGRRGAVTRGKRIGVNYIIKY